MPRLYRNIDISSKRDLFSAYNSYAARIIGAFFLSTSIGQDIKRLRTKQGLSQDDLARNAGLKYSTLAKIEGDFVTKPGVQMIAKIAKALSLSVEDILE